MGGSRQFVSAEVEPEGRVDVCHQADVHDDPTHPPIQARDEREDSGRLAPVKARAIAATNTRTPASPKPGIPPTR
jgi:hypothetical protein